MPAAGCSCSSCRRLRGEIPPDMAACWGCGGPFNRDRSNDYYRCNPCYDEYLDSSSYDDDDDEPSSEYVRNYSYRPSLNFLRAGDSDPDEKLFLGWELEIPTDDENEFGRLIYDGPGKQENVLYCKEDGSIQGVEIVSHPMTHAYFRDQLDLSMFKRSSEQSALLSRLTPGEGYGLHVHVSRAGFKSEAHTLRWLLLIYRNPEMVSRLARRTSQEWSSFSDSKDCAAKAKNKHPRLGDPDQIRRYGYDPHEGYSYEGPRYVAVNAQNRDTFEVRVFRSTWNETEFRAAVDFCHASVAYTRQLPSGEALRGGLTWDRFRQWVDCRPEYTALSLELASYDEDVAA